MLRKSKINLNFLKKEPFYFSQFSKAYHHLTQKDCQFKKDRSFELSLWLESLPILENV
jgi:hypothetical protein